MTGLNLWVVPAVAWAACWIAAGQRYGNPVVMAWVAVVPVIAAALVPVAVAR